MCRASKDTRTLSCWEATAAMCSWLGVVFVFIFMIQWKYSYVFVNVKYSYVKVNIKYSYVFFNVSRLSHSMHITIYVWLLNHHTITQQSNTFTQHLPNNNPSPYYPLTAKLCQNKVTFKSVANLSTCGFDYRRSFSIYLCVMSVRSELECCK